MLKIPSGAAVSAPTGEPMFHIHHPMERLVIQLKTNFNMPFFCKAITAAASNILKRNNPKIFDNIHPQWLLGFLVSKEIDSSFLSGCDVDTPCQGMFGRRDKVILIIALALMIVVPP